MLKTDLIGPFLTFPLGASFEPQGQNCPPGVKLSPGGEIHCSPLHSSKQYRVFTPGEEQRGKHSPRGQRGEVKNGPQGLTCFGTCSHFSRGTSLHSCLAICLGTFLHSWKNRFGLNCNSLYKK
jgi:hypothetical protein